MSGKAKVNKGRDKDEEKKIWQQRFKDTNNLCFAIGLMLSGSLNVKGLNKLVYHRRPEEKWK